MEAEFRIGAFDQFGFGHADLVDGAGNVGGIAVLVGQFQIALVVPRLAHQQAVVEGAQFFVQMRNQCREALAAARLDEGADHQGVDQLDRLVIAYLLAQRRSIAACRQRLQLDLALTLARNTSCRIW